MLVGLYVNVLTVFASVTSKVAFHNDS